MGIESLSSFLKFRAISKGIIFLIFLRYPLDAFPHMGYNAVINVFKEG